MYSSDTAYGVRLFVQPIRFVLQFLFTLFLIVLVFIVHKLLRPEHSVSSGMRFISRKVRRIFEHKFASPAHYRTRYWNTCLPSLRSAALTTSYWSDRSYRLATSDSMQPGGCCCQLLCVTRLGGSTHCVHAHHDITLSLHFNLAIVRLHSPLPPLMQAFGTIYLNTFRAC